jgi:allantoinase
MRRRFARTHAIALRQALRDGTIDYLVSDHSPCTPSLKKLDTGTFLEAWGGIASLQLGLSIAWTLGREQGFSFTELAHWMSAMPARAAGLDRQKGAIAIGRDADFAVFDPEASVAGRGAPSAIRSRPTREGCWLIQATFLRVSVFGGNIGGRRGVLLRA